MTKRAHTREKLLLVLRRRRREAARGVRPGAVAVAGEAGEAGESGDGRVTLDGWVSWTSLFWALRQVNREYERRGDGRRVLLSRTGISRALDELRREGSIDVKVEGTGREAVVWARFVSRDERADRLRRKKRATAVETLGRLADWPDMSVRERTRDEVLAWLEDETRAQNSWFWPGPIRNRLEAVNESVGHRVCDDTLEGVLRVWRDEGSRVQVQKCRNGAVRARLRVTAEEADKRLAEARARRGKREAR